MSSQIVREPSSCESALRLSETLARERAREERERAECGLAGPPLWRTAR